MNSANLFPGRCRSRLNRLIAALGRGLVAVCLPLAGQVAPPEFTSAQALTNGDVVLRWSGAGGQNHLLETTADLAHWRPLWSQRSLASNQFTDAGAAQSGLRFYRVTVQPEVPPLMGDHIQTDDGEVVVRPVNHASFAMSWQGKYLYNDPVGGASPYQGLPRPDLILVSHGHGDHFDAATLAAVRKAESLIIAPAAVYASLSLTLRSNTIPLANGESTNVLGLTVEAVPAYNANHPRGAGNGYVVTLGGRRFYLSGDTGSTPEMRALADIEVAFLCMNLPFTMSIADAVTAVRAFRPRVVYPYHYRNQGGALADVQGFKRQVATDPGVEVRLRTWY